MRLPIGIRNRRLPLLLPIVFGILEIKAGKLSLQHVNCETGQAWLP
jgi:hypothetical protein